MGEGKEDMSCEKCMMESRVFGEEGINGCMRGRFSRRLG